MKKIGGNDFVYDFSYDLIRLDMISCKILVRSYHWIFHPWSLKFNWIIFHIERIIECDLFALQLKQNIR